MKEEALARKYIPRKAPDKVISELEKAEARLQDWLEASKDNAALFRRDPVTALRLAGMDLEDDIMLEIETILDDIAKKLR
jgi:hypothetical protein